MPPGTGSAVTGVAPFISCIMLTANRRRLVPQAIRLFLAQDHAEKERIVLDDGQDSVRDLIPAVRHVRSDRRPSSGEPVRMAHLLAAARSEYARMERPLTAAEIGESP
jgi:hypothetical protein